MRMEVRTSGQRDMTKLVVAFRNFATTPKICILTSAAICTDIFVKLVKVMKGKFIEYSLTSMSQCSLVEINCSSFEFVTCCKLVCNSEGVNNVTRSSPYFVVKFTN